MEEEEDRISCLPDGLLLEIMSRLKRTVRPGLERTMTTKEVIRTTVTISKRWQHLWTLLPNLSFIDEDDLRIGGTGRNVDEFVTPYLSFIDKALTQSPFSKLNKFKLYISFHSGINPEFKSQFIRWIHHAIIHRKVQKVHFYLFDTNVQELLREFIFDDVLFFNNTCFRKMKLRNCLLNPPNGVIRWENLEFLHLWNVTLDEYMIQIILSGTPFLKDLGFHKCYGYRRIDILTTSKSLVMFTFDNYDSFLKYSDIDFIDCIEINAPHLGCVWQQAEWSSLER